MLKYGAENFLWLTVFECENQIEMDVLEIYWIKFMRDNNYQIYNIANGGKGGNILKWYKEHDIAKYKEMIEYNTKQTIIGMLNHNTSYEECARKCKEYWNNMSEEDYNKACKRQKEICNKESYKQKQSISQSIVQNTKETKLKHSISAKATYKHQRENDKEKFNKNCKSWGNTIKNRVFIIDINTLQKRAIKEEELEQFLKNNTNFKIIEKVFVYNEQTKENTFVDKELQLQSYLNNGWKLGCPNKGLSHSLINKITFERKHIKAEHKEQYLYENSNWKLVKLVYLYDPITTRNKRDDEIEVEKYLNLGYKFGNYCYKKDK